MPQEFAHAHRARTAAHPKADFSHTTGAASYKAGAAHTAPPHAETAHYTATATSADSSEMPSFASLGLPSKLVYALKAEGKVTAFPIQADTLPDALRGRDVLGRGRTGSGKTLAFCLPMIARLANGSAQEVIAQAERTKDAADEAHYSDRGAALVQLQRNRIPDDDARSNSHRHRSVTVSKPAGLILAPTRELANQIDEVLAPLAARYGIRTAAVYGGVRYDRQIRKIAQAGIVVACPGRLEDLIAKGAISLDYVACVVIDEADEMADMGFIEPVSRLLEQISVAAQKMLFSATLDHGVDEVVHRFLHNPRVHHVDDENTPVATMTHHVFVVKAKDKNAIVESLASGSGKRILFTRTKIQAQRLAEQLIRKGIPAAQLHGDLNQSQRDRNLQAFERGDTRVMVATDVAARGIDISDVALVVQVDPPQDSKSFTHRSGRTARAGHSGHVVTLVTPNQRKYVRRMMAQAGIHVMTRNIALDDAELARLVGTIAPKVYGWELPALQRRQPAILHKGARGGAKKGSGRRGVHHGRANKMRNTRTAGGDHTHHNAPGQQPKTQERTASYSRTQVQSHTHTGAQRHKQLPQYGNSSNSAESGNRLEGRNRAERRAHLTREYKQQQRNARKYRSHAKGRKGHQAPFRIGR